MAITTFSVILPCFNIVKYFGRCLDSIFSNDMTGNEIIIVNDGSTDSLLSFCNDYFSFRIGSDYFEGSYRGCRVLIITQENQGPSCSRNRGMGLATCDYCLFVDPDDTVSHTWISEIRSTLKEQTPDMLLFGYTIITENEDGTSDTQTVLPLKRYCTCTREDTVKELLPKYIGRSVGNVQNWARSGTFSPPMEHHAVWRIAYRRDFLAENKIVFPPQIVLNEDGIFNADCIAHAVHVSTLMKPLYHYYQRPHGAFYGKARTGKAMVTNKTALLHERIRIIDSLSHQYTEVNYDMIAGATILSIYEMLLYAPKEYRRIREEYIMNPAVRKMIHNMPYVGKPAFDIPLAFLKKKCYCLLHLLFMTAGIVKNRIGKKYM
ncbi:MAG: glycosyltransferase family A protein [Lachnospiraceae bacterium]